jgi:FdhE protein
VTSWDRRIERALTLEREYPAAAELLGFYKKIAEFQKGVALGTERQEIPSLLHLLQNVAPEPLVQAAALLVITTEWDPADPTVQFIHRVIGQAHAEARGQARPAGPTVFGNLCPACGEAPVAAVLRPEGEGGKRSLVCSRCFTEWEFRRLLCPKCGEEDHRKLPVFTTERFPHVRIEACETCRTYVKSIDMTRNGLAIPEVDEMAALPLDLWAAENGFTKLQTNLFGL